VVVLKKFTGEVISEKLYNGLKLYLHSDILLVLIKRLKVSTADTPYLGSIREIFIKLVFGVWA